ncbi:MAG: hypothetical protein HQK86_09665 [Nitrospinae bacterium]|nr:hypothetical protein [Nitrospinota bacterium]
MKDNNYYPTFIEVAADCPVKSSEVPKQRGEEKTIPVLQYEMIANNPYKYTQEDVLFEVFATRNNIPKENRADERKKYFSKGQPCLRCSALGKRYGWGIHFNEKGMAAIYGVETAAYRNYAKDKKLKHVKAMSSKR